MATVRALHQPWAREAIVEPEVLVAMLVVLPVASGLASLLAIAAAARTGLHTRLAAWDLAGAGVVLGLPLLLTMEMGQQIRPLLGLAYMAILALRVGPVVWLVARGSLRSPLFALLTALVAYGAIVLWTGAAAAFQGDQPHYLLAADRLAKGSLDLGPAYASDALFRDLTGGLSFGPGDIETHVARTTHGDRLVQGYGLVALLAPGWALGGANGALLTLALVGAIASLGTYLLCRETVGDARRAGSAWALVTFLAPMASHVGPVYPNVLGAAAIVWAYRWLFTATPRRPLLAGVVAGTTLFLTPRDGITVALLAPFALLGGRALTVRFVAGGGVMLLAAILAGMLTYGVPLPYAGYGFGIEMAQRLDSLPTLTFHVWTGLPGILFDRAFGLAGSAPYVFLGLAGLGAALAGRRGPLVPAVVAVGGSIAALSVYRLWQGGWAPPNRYVVDVLPLWAPLIGLGLSGLGTHEPGRWTVRVLVALSALASVILSAVPTLGYNLSDTSRLTDAIADVLPFSPLSLLPTYVTPDTGSLVRAFAATVPLVALCALIALGGSRRPPRMPAIPRLPAFAALNALGIAALALAPFDVTAGRVLDPDLARSLVTRWLPFALACATALTCALAVHTADPIRLFQRHALLWLAVPAAAAAVTFGDALSPPLYALPLVLLVAGIAALGVTTLWAERRARSDRAIGALLGLTVLAAALALMPYSRTVQLGQSDEPHYLLMMQSLVRDRDLELTNDYDGPYADLYPDRLPDRHIVQVGNAQRPIRDLGLPILGALPFALARRTGVLVLLCAVAALFAWRGYALLRALGFGRGASLGASAATGLLHPAFTYSTQVYPELPASLVLLVAAELLVRPLTVRRAAGVSALCGVLTWLTLRAWFVALPVGAVLIVQALRRREGRLAAAAVVPGALFVALYALVEGMMFSIYLPSAGYFAIRDNQAVLTYTPWIGLPGLLVDRTFGLLSHAPFMAVGLLGAASFAALARRSVAVAALAAGALGEIVYIADIRYWWADGSPAPRYLVAILPFFLVALAAGLARLRTGMPRVLAGAALAWSAAVTFVFALRPDLRYDVAPAGGPGRLWESITFAMRADPALLFPSLVRGALQDVALAAAWLVFLGAVAWAGSRAPRAG